MHNPIDSTVPRIRLTRLLPGLLAAGLMISGPLAAQDEAERPPKPARLFDLQDPLTVTIKAPWNDIERNKRNQDPYPATMEYTDELGNFVALPLTVERRGVKRQEACAFPPIKLRFDKEKVKGTTFRGQDSLKMVTHCDRSRSYEQYYVVEMLIYQLYQELTDYSFRVRSLNIIYFDLERNKPMDDGRFAFLIEDHRDVAKRHDLKKLEIPSISYKRMEPNLASIFSLFQYMIGNVDWASIRGPDPEECCHNVKLIANKPLGEGDWIYAIPYDFDSAGLVDAKYAAPPGGLPIRKVTQRLFRGFCWHNDTLDPARDLFREKRDEMLAVVAKEGRMNSRTRSDVEHYLAGFYEIMDDPKKWEKEVLSECRGKSK
jgi:hypothetical protein